MSRQLARFPKSDRYQDKDEGANKRCMTTCQPCRKNCFTFTRLLSLELRGREGERKRQTERYRQGKREKSRD